MGDKTLLVIWDCSGSMEDMGKMQVASATLAFLRERRDFRLGPGFPFAAIRVAHWKDTAVFAALPDTGAVPAPEAGGRADMEGLVTALDEVLASAGADDLRLLLLSDGAFPDAGVRLLKRWIRQHGLSPRAIAIGADAVRPTLESVCGKRGVFLPQDAGVAIAGWDAEPDDAGPLSLSEVVIPAVANGMGGEDVDWE